MMMSAYSPYGRVYNLDHQTRSVLQNMIPDLRLGDEAARTQPFGVLWLKLAKKLVGSLAGRNGMEVRGCWVDRGGSPGKGVRVH